MNIKGLFQIDSIPDDTKLRLLSAYIIDNKISKKNWLFLLEKVPSLISKSFRNKNIETNILKELFYSRIKMTKNKGVSLKYDYNISSFLSVFLNKVNWVDNSELVQEIVFSKNEKNLIKLLDVIDDLSVYDFNSFVNSKDFFLYLKKRNLNLTKISFYELETIKNHSAVFGFSEKSINSFLRGFNNYFIDNESGLSKIIDEIASSDEYINKVDIFNLDWAICNCSDEILHEKLLLLRKNHILIAGLDSIFNDIFMPNPYLVDGEDIVLLKNNFIVENVISNEKILDFCKKIEVFSIVEDKKIYIKDNLLKRVLIWDSIFKNIDTNQLNLLLKQSFESRFLIEGCRILISYFEDENTVFKLLFSSDFEESDVFLSIINKKYEILNKMDKNKEYVSINELIKQAGRL